MRTARIQSPEKERGIAGAHGNGETGVARLKVCRRSGKRGRIPGTSCPPVALGAVVWRGPVPAHALQVGGCARSPARGQTRLSRRSSESLTLTSLKVTGVVA